uniref:Uncharacterized protein n=1 Tax=Arundo donax TaxID=35708 RepID=A0A0A9JQX0_ARUDO
MLTFISSMNKDSPTFFLIFADFTLRRCRGSLVSILAKLPFWGLTGPYQFSIYTSDPQACVNIPVSVLFGHDACQHVARELMEERGTGPCHANCVVLDCCLSCGWY